jgi:hypothetical protein
MVIWFDDVPLDYANERVMDSLIARHRSDRGGRRLFEGAHAVDQRT